MHLINSDIPELEGTDTATALSNLDFLERELENLLERRISHIYELSDAIITDGEDEDVIKSIILSLRYDPESDLDGVDEGNVNEIKKLYSGISLSERLIIFHRIFSRLYGSQKSSFKNYFEDRSVPDKSANTRIAYLNNSYNDAAYMVFSEAVSAPKAFYASSVSEVCDAVCDGRCEFCILPIETATEGKLLSFYRTILKHSLKINMVYDMTGKNAGEYTRYALLGKNVVSSQASPRARNKERFFDFIVTDKDSLSISEITMSADICCLDLQRIDTVHTFSGNQKSQRCFCLSFKVNRGDLNTFLSYLAVDCPNYIPLGIYTRI